jgi:hypothetical protein
MKQDLTSAGWRLILTNAAGTPQLGLAAMHNGDRRVPGASPPADDD